MKLAIPLPAAPSWVIPKYIARRTLHATVGPIVDCTEAGRSDTDPTIESEILQYNMVGGGWGRDDAARLERDNDKSTVGHTRPRTTWGECATNARRDCNVAIRKARNHVTDVCTISFFHNVLT